VTVPVVVWVVVGVVKSQLAKVPSISLDTAALSVRASAPQAASFFRAPDRLHPKDVSRKAKIRSTLFRLATWLRQSFVV